MAQVRVRPVYPLEGFCEDFGVTLATARREIKEGRLRAYRLRRFLMIAGEDALEWRDFYREAAPIPPAAPIVA